MEEKDTKTVNVTIFKDKLKKRVSNIDSKIFKKRIDRGKELKKTKIDLNERIKNTLLCVKKINHFVN